MEVIRIKAKKIRNIRDLSQFKTPLGKIKENSFIRSSRLDKTDDKTREKLFTDYNIKSVIDLRNKIEVEEGKEYKLPNDASYYYIPVLVKSYFGISHEKKMSKVMAKESKKIKNRNDAKEYMVNMYKSIIFEKYSQEQFKKIFDLFLNGQDGSFLFHCAGGKDRTGILSLFILTILGVSKEDILNDYSMSDICNKNHNNFLTFLMHAFLYHIKLKWLLIEMLHAKKEYMIETINAIEEKYGSINKYLELEIGLTQDKQDKFRELYLVK